MTSSQHPRPSGTALACNPIEQAFELGQQRQRDSCSLDENAHPGLPEPQRVRLRTAGAVANANVERAGAFNVASMQRLAESFSQLQDPRFKPAQALARLRSLASQWSSQITPHSACRHGCAHCCHIPVAIARWKPLSSARRSVAR